MRYTVHIILCVLGTYCVCFSGIMVREKNKPVGNLSLLLEHKEKAREIAFFTTVRNSHISVLKTNKGKKFIVKQDSRDVIHGCLCAARDILGAQVALSVGVLANRVIIIPAHVSFVGKHMIHFPATLHEFVPGTLVSRLPPSLKKFKGSLKQYIKPHLPPDQQGLTRSIIENMSQHPDLCALVAVDTFIANIDRHTGNYFYHKLSNRFYAIDFEGSFKHDLASYACTCIEKLIFHGDKKLSQKEIDALGIYRHVLTILIDSYTPESLSKQLFTLVMEGDVISPSQQSVIVDKLSTHKRMMQQNYDSCKKLVALLDTLIKKNKD